MGVSDYFFPVNQSHEPMRYHNPQEHRSKSLYHSIILVGLWGFPYWNISIPNILGSIIPKLTINQPSFISYIHLFPYILMVKTG